MNAEFFTKTEEIPDGYDSYIGLLIPERDLRQPLLPPEDLFQRFYALGVAIGSKNLAYWFYWASVLELPRCGLHVKAVVSTPTPSFNDIIARHTQEFYHRFEPEYDTERARRYCDRYSLSYNNGPYIVYSECHPDKVSKPDITVQLNGLTHDQYIVLLNSLEQSILLDRAKLGKVKTQTLLARWRNALADSRDAALKMVEILQGFL